VRRSIGHLGEDDLMSVNDEIEKIWLERVKKGTEEGNVYLEGVHGVELAIKWFSPVYLTCLEIEKEFGQGRGIEVNVKRHYCSFEATHKQENNEHLSVMCVTHKKIEVSHNYGEDRIIKTTKKAINEIVTWVGNNMSGGKVR